MKQRLIKVFETLNVSYKIDMCSESNLSDYILKYDFLFLDIELGNENGIDIGIRLKRKHPDLHIILTSSFKKYLEDGYKTGAERYFIKPIDPTLFEAEMKDLIKEYSEENSHFMIRTL